MNLLAAVVFSVLGFTGICSFGWSVVFALLAIGNICMVVKQIIPEL